MYSGISRKTNSKQQVDVGFDDFPDMGSKNESLIDQFGEKSFQKKQKNNFSEKSNLFGDNFPNNKSNQNNQETIDNIDMFNSVESLSLIHI